MAMSSMAPFLMAYPSEIIYNFAIYNIRLNSTNETGVPFLKEKSHLQSTLYC